MGFLKPLKKLSQLRLDLEGDSMLSFIGNLFEEEYSFIFLGGIHGVGKTTLCEKIFIPEGYHCITASSLIKESGVILDQNKQVRDISDNQIILINRLILEKQKYKRLLVDGHYCLINKQDQIVPIDIEVFRNIKPSVFILLKDCASKVVNRLKERDDKKWNQLFLDQFQEIEEQHAKYIAHELSIPLQILSNEDMLSS